MNRPFPKSTCNFKEEPEAEALDINTGPIETTEIKNAIQSLANNKAGGEDEITPEMLKAMDETNLGTLKILFNKVWEEEKVPEQWRNGIIVKIPKKGDLSDCNNWRGITLLSVVSKVFTKIMLSRIRDAVDSKLREEQAGFRPGRSCTDQIFVLRIILEEYMEKQKALHMNFIDFKKAFDSLHRDSLWQIMKLYGIPAKIITITESLYKNNRCTVRTEEGLSDWFQVETGVKQGCIMSPLLFGIAVDFIMRKCTKEQTGILWTDGKQLEDLDFADDIALLSDTSEKMQKKTTKLAEIAEKVGLQISHEKTKVMKNAICSNNSIQLGEQRIEEVTQFTYLGSCIDHNGELKKRDSNKNSKSSHSI